MRVDLGVGGGEVKGERGEEPFVVDGGGVGVGEGEVRGGGVGGPGGREQSERSAESRFLRLANERHV